MLQLIRRMISSNSKFRIIFRGNKFVPQEFIGIWKLGLYADISKEFGKSDHTFFQFEHEKISGAESVIERRKKQLPYKNYVVKDYYKS